MPAAVTPPSKAAEEYAPVAVFTSAPRTFVTWEKPPVPAQVGVQTAAASTQGTMWWYSTVPLRGSGSTSPDPSSTIHRTGANSTRSFPGQSSSRGVGRMAETTGDSALGGTVFALVTSGALTTCPKS
jgi:hypothetical protein